jgi:hypothetical protein
MKKTILMLTLILSSSYSFGQANQAGSPGDILAKWISKKLPATPDKDQSRPPFDTTALDTTEKHDFNCRALKRGSDEPALMSVLATDAEAANEIARSVAQSLLILDSKETRDGVVIYKAKVSKLSFVRCVAADQKQ